MRFISHIRQLQVGILAPVQEILPGGLIREVVPEYSAEFQQGGLTLEETEWAEGVFQNVRGRTQQQDEVTMTPILNRLSLYDSGSVMEQSEFEQIDRLLEGQTHPTLPRGEVWTFGRMQELTEGTLLKIPDYGQLYLRYEAPAAAPPWPTYNEFVGSAEDLIAVLEAQGHFLPGALAYELENLNRPDVVELLEERIKPEPVEEFVQ